MYFRILTSSLLFFIDLHISIVGGVVVVTGLYLVVWGKSKEQKSVKSPSSEKEIAKQAHQQLPITVPKIDSNDNYNKEQLVIVRDQTSLVEVEGPSTNNQ